MEVFMRNVPRHLTDGSLAAQLDPYLKDLGIGDYLCEKHVKPTAQLTFLHKRDGLKFLERHGEQAVRDQHQRLALQSRKNKHPQTHVQLTILGKQIYCKQSKYLADPITLRVIENTPAERQAREPAPKNGPVAFELWGLSCGYNAFTEGGEMAFAPQWATSQRGMARFAKRKLFIDLKDSNVKLRVPFTSIVEVLQGKDEYLLITLSTPPEILSSLTQTWDELLGRISPHDRVPAIDPQHADCSPYCLVYLLQLPGTDFREKMSRVAANKLSSVTRHDVPVISFGQHLQPYGARIRALKNQLSADHAKSNLPFGVLFLLQALIHNGYLNPEVVSELAIQLRGVHSRDKDLSISVEAMKQLFLHVDYPSPFCDSSQFEVTYLLDLLRKAERELRAGAVWRSDLVGQSDYAPQTYRAIVTPTRITLHGPEATTNNRILRKYPDHTDWFLRVQFGDENGEDLFFNAKISLEKIYHRFRGVLMEGIEIAGRSYKFLGFSHSSLRAHTAWFCAPFFKDGQMHTHFSIIDELGEFTQINCVARRAARIGQAFSETPYSVPLEGISVSCIEDVKSADGARVFSDGVGTLSEAAAAEIRRHLPEGKGWPTCFQIRYAGIKGMLSEDARLPGLQICYRPSMKKFESNDISHLELCDMASRPIPLVLNRPLIKILEDIGAPATWFLRLQSLELTYLRSITASCLNTSIFLKYQAVGRPILLSQLVLQLDAMGIDYRRDRFMRGVVEAVVLRELRLLKHKSRIPVQQGITLFGVMDETGYLDEREVYIACDPDPKRRLLQPREGWVLVSRSPCLHPGDVQKAWNARPPPDHPLLRLRNCVVFSQKGARDLPSQLGGGDLDGDIYNVIWDPALVDTDLMVHRAADYPRVTPRILNRPVEKADMAKFFVDFMNADHLGVIATRHMVLADQMNDGTLNEKCIHLAQLHSTAVDFSKTGIPVELRELPRSKRFKPDFYAPGPLTQIHDKSEIDLEEYVVREDGDENDDSPRHEYYRSDKILGQLYRAIDEQRIWREDVKMATHTDGPAFWDDFVRKIRDECSAIGPVSWEARRVEAEGIRYAYEDAVLGAMRDFSDSSAEPLSELEVFVGHVVGRAGAQTRRERDRSRKLREEFERISSWIVRHMREGAAADPLGLCLACAHVACVPSGRGGRRLESFRVVAAGALVQEIKARKLRSGRAGI